MKANNGFKIGEVIYYENENAWVDGMIQKASIMSFGVTEIKGVDVPYAETKGLNFVGEGGALLSSIYRSEQKCIDAMKARNEAKRQEYRDEIKNEKDLVKFMYRHCINGDEYTDWHARAVVEEKAAEFEINLNS